MCSAKAKEPHIEIISKLVTEGKNDKEIADELVKIKQINLSYDEVFWEEEDVKKIREENSFSAEIEHYFSLEGMKLCPECQRNIKEKAFICKFCKKELNYLDNSIQVEEEILISQDSYQKFSILGLLISFSAILHMTFCEWGDMDHAGWTAKSIIPQANYDSYGIGIIFPFFEDNGFGVYADHLLNGNVILGLVLGVLLPMVLIGVSVYLYVGWQKSIEPVLKKHAGHFFS